MITECYLWLHYCVPILRWIILIFFLSLFQSISSFQNGAPTTRKCHTQKRVGGCLGELGAPSSCLRRVLCPLPVASYRISILPWGRTNISFEMFGVSILCLAPWEVFFSPGWIFHCSAHSQHPLRQAVLFKNITRVLLSLPTATAATLAFQVASGLKEKKG